MAQQDEQIRQVFPFWKAVEALTPQKMGKDKPHDAIAPAYKVKLSDALPWVNNVHISKHIPCNKIWHYTAQCGVYNVDPLAKLLTNKIGAHEDVAEEQKRSQSRLFDISFNEAGIPQFDSFILSLAVWSAGQVLEHEDGVMAMEHSKHVDLSDLPAPDDTIPLLDSGYPYFDLLTQHLMQWVANEAVYLTQKKRKADTDWIAKLVEKVLDKTIFPRQAMNSDFIALVKCVQVKKPEKMEPGNDEVKKKEGFQKSKSTPAPEAISDDLLNSFFIQELRKLETVWSKKDYGKGFSEYMRAISEPQRQRIDTRSPEGLKSAFQRLLPDKAPAGSWPSQYPLAFSQQLAVNQIWRRHARNPGIFSVNGPPGTGKTTLLRDVVAAVVTERAQKLIEHLEDAFEAKKSTKIGNIWFSCYPLHKDIQGFSIVVASANNGAVENISLELPGEDAVPKSVIERSDYFSDLVPELIGKPGWGLLAAKLGNKSNREEFMNIFWWRKPKKEDEEDVLPPPTKFTPSLGEGLAYHLKMIAEGSRSPALSCADAVSRFKQAQGQEAAARQQLLALSTQDEERNKNYQNAEEMKGRQKSIINELSPAQTQLLALKTEVERLESVYNVRHQQIETIQRDLAHQASSKPGVFDWIVTLGRAHKNWWERYHCLTNELDSARRDSFPQSQMLTLLRQKQTDAEKRVYDLAQELRQTEATLDELRKNIEAAENQREQAKLTLGEYWPDPDATDDVREKSAPWAATDWRVAREALFLAALDIHRAFIESHPNEFISNINLANGWLQGRNLSEEQAKLALESLTLVVPVISTTFASIPRMFKRIGREAIGWLLIDEAGQALPQQASGAIWRAARIVVVGDPKQLEPVSGIPLIVEAALARHHGIPSVWWPCEVSTQILADQTMDFGTSLPDPAKGLVWVGCPLRVHRRCDNPMFAVSNRIAYGGLMVHGKRERTISLPQSSWINIVGKNCEGNWVEEEGEAVEKLLHSLREKYQVPPENIFLISPFKDCSVKLSEMAYRLGMDTRKTGTVHTTQGKEADVVILVLGGNLQKPGAKAWAAERPNLLNVAVSRAKQRLYVVGDRAQWRKQNYFSILAEFLATDGIYIS